jgi:hypothetical protein
LVLFLWLKPRHKPITELKPCFEGGPKKAIELYNGTWDSTKKATMGRPKRKLEPEYISAVEEVVENINTTGSISTVKKIKKTLDESYDLQVSLQSLLRDLHQL